MMQKSFAFLVIFTFNILSSCNTIKLVQVSSIPIFLYSFVKYFESNQKINSLKQQQRRLWRSKQGDILEDNEFNQAVNECKNEESKRKWLGLSMLIFFSTMIVPFIKEID